ncbi:MAG: DUF535 family protein [Alphaproteobacteria bacterium]|nr:DUF535 family protein [Alphaproteobacteria bacterium]
MNFSKLFQQTDNRDGGPIQAGKRRLKMWLRYQANRTQLQRLETYLQEHDLQDLLAHTPHHQLKCFRSYLWDGLSGAQRMDAQISHLDWLRQHWTGAGLSNLYQQLYIVLFSWKIQDHQFDFLLGPSRGMDREGDLEAHLNIDGVPLLRTCFSILPMNQMDPSASGDALFIGGLQGGQDAKDLTKLATQLFERTKPPHVLMNILQGLAQGWRLEAIVGVAHDRHVYASYGSLSKRMTMNYDQLWQELGATHTVNGKGWRLPLIWEARPLEDVESKKRSQLRRRNELRQKLSTLAKEASQNWGNRRFGQG